MALTVQELDPKRHDRASFDCGVEALNRYLSNLAVQHRAKGIATTFVLVEAKDSAAASFYRKYGFRLCDEHTRQFYLPLGRD